MAITPPKVIRDNIDNMKDEKVTINVPTTTSSDVDFIDFAPFIVPLLFGDL